MYNGVIEQLQNAIDVINTVFQNMEVWLTTSPDAFGGGAAWAVVTQVNVALKGIGYGLFLMFLLMSLLKSTTNFKEIGLQQFFGWAIRGVLVFILVGYGLDLLQFFVTISLGANSEILSLSNGLGTVELPPDLLEAAEAAADESWWSALPMFFQGIPLFILALISTLVIWICGIIMVVIVYMRFFRVFIYTAIAPLPLSTFGSPDTSQTGKHFIKAYAAVCLEICVISLACVLFSAIVSNGGLQIWDSWSNVGLQDDVYGEYWGVTMNFIIQLVIQTVLLTISVSSSNKIIREIMGV